MPVLEHFRRAVFSDSQGDAIEASQDFEFSFSIARSMKRDPDTAEIMIKNLSPSVIKMLSVDAVRVDFYAGIKPDPPMLFTGEITDTVTAKSSSGTDDETTVYAEDTNSKLVSKVISRAFSSGANLKNVLSNLAAAAEIQIDYAGTARITDALSLLGRPSKIISEVCDLYGLRYQIIDKVMIIKSGLDPISTVNVPVISDDTGKRGWPTSELEKKIIKVSATTDLNAELVPGGLCVIKTNAIGSRKAPIKPSSTYQIERQTHSGDKKDSITNVVCREY